MTILLILVLMLMLVLALFCVWSSWVVPSSCSFCRCSYPGSRGGEYQRHQEQRYQTPTEEEEGHHCFLPSFVITEMVTAIACTFDACTDTTCTQRLLFSYLLFFLLRRGRASSFLFHTHTLECLYWYLFILSMPMSSLVSVVLAYLLCWEKLTIRETNPTPTTALIGRITFDNFLTYRHIILLYQQSCRIYKALSRSNGKVRTHSKITPNCA